MAGAASRLSISAMVESDPRAASASARISRAFRASESVTACCRVCACKSPVIRRRERRRVSFCKYKLFVAPLPEMLIPFPQRFLALLHDPALLKLIEDHPMEVALCAAEIQQLLSGDDSQESV